MGRTAPDTACKQQPVSGFCDYLNGYDDDFLKAHQYTREEIGDGIKQLLREYDMEALEEFVDM